MHRPSIATPAVFASPGALRSHGATTAAMALAFYLAMALVMFWRGHPIQTEIFGYGADPVSFVWYLHWWPYAILHGLNPFVTHKVWHAVGYNLTWSTSVPFFALLMTPVTYALNAVATHNILIMLMPPLGAWVAFLLLRDTFHAAVPALLGGAIYGFSSYESTQMLSHLNLATILFVPLALLLCKRRLDGRLGRPAFIILLAFVAWAQLGSSSEILATATLFGGLLWFVMLLFGPADARRRLLFLATEVCAAGVLTIIAAAPFLYYFVRGFASAPDWLGSTEIMSADLFGLVVPTEVNYLGGTLFRSLAAKFTAGLFEQGCYIGLPLVLIAGAVMLSRRGWTGALRAVSVLTLVICIAALGPTLHLFGETTAIRLPWAVLGDLPLLNIVLPVRFGMYLALAVATLFTAWLTADTAPAWLAVGVASVLFLAPAPAMLQWFPWPSDPFFTRDSIEHTLGHDKTVLLLPFGSNGSGMAWQLDAGLTFNQSAGYGGYTPRQIEGLLAIDEMQSGVPGPGFKDDMAAYCGFNEVDFIVMGSDTPQALQDAVRALGWPAERHGSVDVIRVPPAASLNYALIVGDYWGGTDPLNWIGREARVITHGKPVVLKLSTAGRPAGSGPASFTLQRGHGVERFEFGDKSEFLIPLAANGDATIRSDSTFIPARLIHNDDERALTLNVGLLPAP
jgi:hypothetical protein